MPTMCIVLHMTEPQTSGADLRRARMAQRLKLRHIAAVMGVSVSRVGNIEREAAVSASIAGRYRAAILTCLTRTSEDAA